MSEINLSQEFLERRKKEFASIYSKAKSTDLNSTFRGKTYKEFISILMSKVFSVVSITDAIKAKTTGVFNIKNKITKKNIGILYLREYNDTIKSNETNNYDIEILIEKDELKEGKYIINFVNEVFGEADLLVKPENMPSTGIFIWTSGNGFYDDLNKRLKSEYGENTIIKEKNNNNKVKKKV